MFMSPFMVFKSILTYGSLQIQFNKVNCLLFFTYLCIYLAPKISFLASDCPPKIFILS